MYGTCPYKENREQYKETWANCIQTKHYLKRYIASHSSQCPIKPPNIRSTNQTFDRVERKGERKKEKMRWTVQSLTNLNLTISRPNPIEGRKGGGEKIQDQPNPLQP
jgi:hypothetical protein